jgi:hypothetical protein
MGGTLSTMFTAIHQDLVKNLVLLATGIDYSTREVQELQGDRGIYADDNRPFNS